MSCEMCGKFAGPSLVEAEVDGAIMYLCPQCSKFGSKVAKNKAGLSETSETEVTFVRNRSGEKGPSVSHVKVRTGDVPTSTGMSRQRTKRDILYSDKELVDNYGEVIKKARMEKGLSLDDFAQMINEKSSILQKIEKNEFTPSDQLIVKIERRLEISLKEETAAATYYGTSSSQKDTTLGDLVKLKKKKK